MMQRRVWSLALTVAMAAACSGEEEGGSKQEQFWDEWCADLDCDPSDPLWQDGLINGHQVQAVTNCPVDTGYPGDDAALCPPDEGHGFQLHFGPADYKDADDVARFLLGPMEEDERCQYVRTTNTEVAYINQYAGRMRPQSHHMILWGPVGTRARGGHRRLSRCRWLDLRFPDWVTNAARRRARPQRRARLVTGPSREPQ